MEAVIDAFDLCRFHNILVQAPRGAPCAYKEMGRCAAPCDGSEAMESYRARVRGAVGFLERLAGGTAFEDVQGAIADASRAMDFERAAAMKAFVDRCGPLRKPGFAAVSTLERFRWIIAAPSGKKGWARLFWCDAGELSVLVDVRVQDGRNVIGEVAAGVVARPARACTASLPSESLDTLGLVSRWALDRGRKKKVALVRVGLPGEPPPVEDLTRAVRSAGSGKHDEGPMPEAEMESLV
jgi:hypothetical protein